MKRGLGLAAVVATLLGALAGTAPAAVAEVPAADCVDGYDFGLTTWEMYGRWLTAGVEVVDCTTGLGAAGQVAIVAAGDGLPTDIDAAPGVTTMVGGLVGAHAELPSFESETAVVVLFRPAGSDQTVAWPTFVTTEAAPVLPVSPTASVAVSRPDGSRYPDGSVQAGARLDIGGSYAFQLAPAATGVVEVLKGDIVLGELPLSPVLTRAELNVQRALPATLEGAREGDVLTYRYAGDANYAPSTADVVVTDARSGLLPRLTENGCYLAACQLDLRVRPERTNLSLDVLDGSRFELFVDGRSMATGTWQGAGLLGGAQLSATFLFELGAPAAADTAYPVAGSTIRMPGLAQGPHTAELRFGATLGTKAVATTADFTVLRPALPSFAVTPSAATVKAGGLVTLTMHSPWSFPAGLTVDFQRRVGTGAWTTFATTVTGADGTARASALVAATATYRAVTRWTELYDATSSDPVKVTAQRALTLTTSPHRRYPTSKTYITATVNPTGTVYLQALNRSKRWVTIASAVPTAKSGRGTVSFLVNRVSVAQTFRVVVNADANGTGAIATVGVKALGAR